MMLPTKRETNLETGGVKEESSSGNVNVEAKPRQSHGMCHAGLDARLRPRMDTLFCFFFFPRKSRRRERRTNVILVVGRIGHRRQSKGIESAVCRLLRVDDRVLLPQSRSFERMAAAHALFVCLDVAHLAAIRAFALRCLGLSSSSSGICGGWGWGFGAVDGRGHADVDAGNGGAGRGTCDGGGRGVDSFGLFALVSTLAVLLQAGELVGNAADVSEFTRRWG